jgi:hypothetical protein
MRWKQFRTSLQTATPTATHRASFAVLVFCLINAAWSAVGDWSISFGGENYRYFDSAWRQSGVFSCGGYLVLAERSSLFMSAGVRPPDWQTRKPIHQAFPWSISAEMDIGPQRFSWHRGNGIIDDRPRQIVPGLLLNWQNRSSRGEWYNRGIAIHWTLLAALAAFLPALALIRHHRRAVQGRCDVCGYDLRATPRRCPECGNITDPGDAPGTQSAAGADGRPRNAPGGIHYVPPSVARATRPLNGITSSGLGDDRTSENLRLIQV